MFYSDTWNENNTLIKHFQINGTIILTMIQITIHVVTLMIRIMKRICLLYLLGSKYTPAIRFNYHFHRLFNPIFLHVNESHLLANMVS